MTSKEYLRELFGFAAPIYFANLFQQFYHAADTMIIGNLLGEHALAAVGSVAGIAYLLFNVSAGVASGYSVEIAKAYGAKERRINSLIMDALLSSFVLGFAAALIFFFGSDLFVRLLNIPSDIAESAVRYINILFLGLPVTLLHNMLNATLRAIGDSRTPSAALILSLLLNLLLDIVLVGPLNMGIGGAALATVVSQITSAAICAFSLSNGHGITLSIDDNVHKHWDNIIVINRIGLPYGMQFFITSLGINAVQRAVNIYGAAVIAGFSSANKLHAVFAQMHVALGTALMTLTAQDVGRCGAGKVFERAGKVYPVFLLCAVGNGLILEFGGEALAAFFSRESTPEMVKAAGTYFHTVIWFYPFLTSIFHVRNVLTGLGKSGCALIGSLVEFAIRVSVSCVFSTAATYSGICLSDPLAWLAGLIPLLIFYMYEVKTKRI